jgi:hypothetical protein
MEGAERKASLKEDRGRGMTLPEDEQKVVKYDKVGEKMACGKKKWDSADLGQIAGCSCHGLLSFGVNDCEGETKGEKGLTF